MRKFTFTLINLGLAALALALFWILFLSLKAHASGDDVWFIYKGATPSGAVILQPALPVMVGAEPRNEAAKMPPAKAEILRCAVTENKEQVIFPKTNEQGIAHEMLLDCSGRRFAIMGLLFR